MNPVDEILEIISEENPEASYPTDLKDAIIGIVRRKGMSAQILLDEKKCVDILVERDGMSREDAVEYLEFNTFDAFIGEDSTPCFAELIEPQEGTR